jgi:C4-dicarboxylate-specific signal transduction histidine kinase
MNDARRRPSHGFRRVIAQSLSGCVALALLTFVCFRLGFNLATAACLYMAIIVMLSLQGSLLASAIVSLLGVGCLAYYFAPPIFSFRVEDPFNLIAIITYVTVSAVVSKLRLRADQLAAANAALEAQIAERKRAEEGLLDVRAKLEHVSHMNTMGELTASLAHEVNQPIAAAVINANACVRWLSGDFPNLEEARTAARRIVQDGARAADIVNRSRLNFKKGPSQQELVDVGEISRELIALLRGQAARYSVSVRTDLAADPCQVMGDRAQLQQLMLNLIMNGIDALKDVDGARQLAIQSQRTEDGQLLVSVSDTGVGLPPQQADQIFNALFTTKPHGTGIGLSICRSIVESHGGRLWAADNCPRGASFHFTLPIAVGVPG